MQIEIAKSKIGNADVFIRRCGYGKIPGRGEISYARRLRGTPYPRFHIYIQDTADSLIIKLHLDQKQPTYEGVTAHSGEYDGPLVQREIERINGLVSGQL